jgi:hypothetical protein
MLRVPFSGRLPLVLAVLTALFLPALCGAQEHMTMFGRTSVASAERTDAGDWDGTWVYVSKRRRIALWIRSGDGGPELKLRMNEKGTDILTDWEGHAEYVSRNRPGKFSLQVDQRDEDTISGRWIWRIGTDAAGRQETADFTMHRAGRGRRLVMRVENWSTENWGGFEEKYGLPLQVWSFQKASRRMALWGELPF